MDSAKDYAQLVQEPWGKIFYDLLFLQLNLPPSPKQKILDFGAGLGVTSNHYAKWHEVIAVEPNKEMIENRRAENPYKIIHGGIEVIAKYENSYFDMVLCHNVLEYVEEKEPIIVELMRVLKPGGILSLVKHNRTGRVFQTAVFKNDPKKALSLLDININDKSNYLGTQYIYSNDDAAKMVEKYGGIVDRFLGMRAFYALGQDNAVKYYDEWYQNMVALEIAVSDIDEYKNAAFLSHMLENKKG